LSKLFEDFGASRYGLKYPYKSLSTLSFQSEDTIPGVTYTNSA